MTDLVLPSFHDLDAFAASLAGADRYKAFVDQVRRYRDAMSVVNDLRECTELLDVLEKQSLDADTAPRDDTHRPVIAGALLAQAVIWYVRATKTSSDHRGFVPITAKMPTELVALHQRMADLRDRALAHFGPGWDGDRPRWVREVAALRLDGDQATLTFLYSRSKVQTDLPEQLRRLVEFAVPRAWEIASQRADILLAECRKLYDSDGAFAASLRSSMLDLWRFFDGDPNAVRQAFESRATAETFVPASYWRQSFSSS